MTALSDRIARTIATDIGAQPQQVIATVAMLDSGDTVPFIARYRKEATGSLDDAQLRRLAERLDYLRELEQRRASILEEIRKQDKLTDTLARDIVAGMSWSLRSRNERAPWECTSASAFGPAEVNSSRPTL